MRSAKTMVIGGFLAVVILAGVAGSEAKADTFVSVTSTPSVTVYSSSPTYTSYYSSYGPTYYASSTSVGYGTYSRSVTYVPGSYTSVSYVSSSPSNYSSRYIRRCWSSGSPSISYSSTSVRYVESGW